MKIATQKILTLLLITTLFSSCALDMFNRVNGNRNVVTEDRSTKEDFTKIKVSTGLKLYISQGSKNKIIVEADENLQDLETGSSTFHFKNKSIISSSCAFIFLQRVYFY